MTLKEKLTNNFPATINKTKPIFKALVANDSGTGTIEQVLTNLLEYMQEWRNSSDIYEMEGTAFQKTYSLITFLSMFEGETEDAFKERLKSIFVRDGDTVWGTPYDIQQLFQSYFTKANVYVIENVDSLENNLVQNYDFDEDEDTVWTYYNCAKDKEARFSKAYGVLFQSGGYCYQTLTDITPSKSHHLHFFHVGDIEVSIQNPDSGKFWNGTTWSTTETKIKCKSTSTEWESGSIHVFTDSETTELKLTFYGAEGAYLDYITLYEYLGYPTFKVFVQYVGDSSAGSLSLAPGNADPTSEIKNYSLAGYYEQVYLTGQSSGFSQQIYSELLQYVKSEGVKAFMEFVTRNN